MSLIVYNGSPRGDKSNSSIITNWFLEGYGNDNVEIRYLNKVKQHLSYIEEIHEFEQVLMVFPLYVDGMPGQVKYFFETLSLIKDKLLNKEITFIIHSGFSEGIQSKTLEHYLNRFCNIMGFNNHGVIIIPGSEGFRVMPPSMTKKKRISVSRFGSLYKSKESYNDSDLKYLFGKEKSSNFSIFVFKLFNKIGLTNLWWKSQLKKNNAYENRFDAPYKNNPTQVTSKAYICNSRK